jgi:hypothetical protein
MRSSIRPNAVSRRDGQFAASGPRAGALEAREVATSTTRARGVAVALTRRAAAKTA